MSRHFDNLGKVPVDSRPVVVVTPPTAVAEVSATLPHCEVVPAPLRSRVLLRLVTQATPPHTQEATRAVEMTQH